MKDPLKFKKKIMFVSRRAPYGTGYGLEMLEAILAGSALEQHVSVAFIDDGVYQLMSDQDPADLELKQYTKTFKALPDFDIVELYVEHESLQARGLDSGDLMQIVDESKCSLVKQITSQSLSALMDQQDVIVQL